ncbi:nuclear transcription factor Y subunit B-4-like isoform X2 [Panicum virgatum]|uniref:nuclear transcription factor Y subunit B-4-like isoform X2 n=1 Tax=Panicum virgatum TaxID=38727 RepID=UPI0019D60DBA|nr:nuclear transcription factor Y subunit B-4-like isoform X2 [Panicum virgatum]
MSEAESAPETGGGSYGGKEQDRYLPIANIGRIMRRAVPENGKIAKDAKESVQECVSEFISFITSEASDKCMKEKRKTINGEDLIWSMGTLGFEEYVEPLKHYLKLYRETEGDTKGSKSSDHTGKKEIVLNGEPGSSDSLHG